MEKGSFHTSVKSVREMDDFVENLPLPNQLPNPIDASRLPSEVLQSRAVETLLGQNADLMARLGVVIRGSSGLESKIAELEKENAHLRHRYDSVKDQILVVQEKERLLTQRSNQVGQETTSIRDRLTNLERRYAEVYMQSQSLERQVRRLRNYRFRVQAVAARLKASSLSLHAILDPENLHPNGVGAVLKLAETEFERISDENSTAQKDVASRYENELNSLKGEMELLRRRAADRDLLYDAKIRIENQLVFDERQNRHYREETQKELLTLKEENQDLSGQLKTRLIEIDRYEREISVALDRLTKFEDEDKKTMGQIESLQLLWKEKQDEVERITEKNRSLQKLNQQLSVNINSQRKEIVELKAELEKERYQGEEKIKAFEMQLKK